MLVQHEPRRQLGAGHYCLLLRMFVELRISCGAQFMGSDTDHLDAGLSRHACERTTFLHSPVNQYLPQLSPTATLLRIPDLLVGASARKEACRYVRSYETAFFISVNSFIYHFCGNMKLSWNEKMGLCWTAEGLLEGKTHFERLKASKYLPVLNAELQNEGSGQSGPPAVDRLTDTA